MHFSLRRCFILPLLALLALLLALPGVGVAAAQTGEYCFNETGYCISGRIREFWERNGGLAVFGYPIGPQHEEMIEGQAFQVQWFERNRLELHPENEPPFDVLLGRLGVDMLEQEGVDWKSLPRDDEAEEGCLFFEQTGQNVCGEILAAWQENGLAINNIPGATFEESLALFGLPISPAQMEEIEGEAYTVQWFERARFELHPEEEPPYNVLLGLLGNELQPGTPAIVTDPIDSQEQPVLSLPLTGAIADRNAEISGMAWYGDYLVLLPQYPNFANDYQGEGEVFVLPKADIIAFLDGVRREPLEPVAVPFIAPGLQDSLDGFEGYEAIGFDGNRVFITIEAQPEGEAPRGYLLKGNIAPDLSELTLDPSNLVEIAAQSASENKAEEALLITSNAIITIYEVHGAALNPNPIVHVFDKNLLPAGTISMPNVEYRITDATGLDGSDQFWVINSFFPGDSDLLPATDPLAEQHGEGPSHSQSEIVERLVELQYSDSGITLTDEPPIQLQLEEEARNWEGLVRLESRGFLLVTDKFPETILGFVAIPS